jgi:Transposase
MSISETMTKRHRRAFSPEFKAEVVALCHQPGKSVASVARELGLTETAVRRWVNQAEVVYISGFAPDEGENLTELQSKFPPPGIIPYIVQHDLSNGGKEFTLAPQGFHETFCADVPHADAAFYAASQRPLAGVALSEPAPTPAWRSRPVWGRVGDRRPVYRPRRPPLQLRPNGRHCDRGRRGFACGHDLASKAGRRGNHDRSP